MHKTIGNTLIGTGLTHIAGILSDLLFMKYFTSELLITRIVPATIARAKFSIPQLEK